MKNFLRKFTSVKTWIALWSMVIITYITLKGAADFNNLAMLLTGPIVGYLAANVWQDKLYLDKGGKE
jgi:uncharacterized membrane protein (DUF441 family)